MLVEKEHKKKNDCVDVVQESFDEGAISDVLIVYMASFVDTWILDAYTSHRITFSCNSAY